MIRWVQCIPSCLAKIQAIHLTTVSILKRLKWGTGRDIPRNSAQPKSTWGVWWNRFVSEFAEIYAKLPFILSQKDKALQQCQPFSICHPWKSRAGRSPSSSHLSCPFAVALKCLFKEKFFFSMIADTVVDMQQVRQRKTSPRNNKKWSRFSDGLAFLPCDSSPFLLETSLLSRDWDQKFINQQTESEMLSSDERTAQGQLLWLCLSMSEKAVDPGKLTSFFPAAWDLTRTWLNEVF